MDNRHHTVIAAKIIPIVLLMLFIITTSIGCGSSTNNGDAEIADVVIHSFKEDPGTELDRPGSGNTYLVLDLEVTKKSGKVISTKSEIMQQGITYVWFALNHPDGYRYSESFLQSRAEPAQSDD